MIKGVGIDAVPVERVRRMIERFGGRFTRRVFTPAEIDYCEGRRRPAEAYAARFAAKEAVMKALGHGWGSGVRFVHIEVSRGERGRPVLVLHQGAQKAARDMGVQALHLSMAHEADLAMAQAIAETGREG